MKKRNIYLFITFLVFLIFNCFQSTFAQDITAVYFEKNQTLSIKNNSNKTILLQKEEWIITCNKEFDLFFGGYVILVGDSLIVDNISVGQINSGDKITYFNQGLDEPFVKTPSEIDITIKINPEIIETNDSGFQIQWWMYAAAIGVLIFLVLLIYLLARKKKPVDKTIAPENNIFEAIEEDDDDITENVVGLDGVKRELQNYYTIDARHIYSDTAICEIFISRFAIKSIYDLFKKFLENPDRTPETGCYIIGRWEYADVEKTSYNISLEHIIEPGDDVIYGEYELNFGHKIGVMLGSKLVNMSEKTKCDYEHTAWMHSHPGLGLFLSTHDLDVQKRVAVSGAKSRMLAIVIDTNTSNWETAFFTPKKNGSMNNKEEMKDKTYSWELLYQWSRSSQPEQTTTKIIKQDNYFALSVKNDTTHSILFAAKAINDIDDILYSNNKGLIGFFSGFTNVAENNLQNIIIDNCINTSSDTTCGCLIAETSAVYPDILIKYANAIKQYHFIIIYRSDTELFLSIKNKDKVFPAEEKSPLRFSLGEMKEWTRRRRM